MSTLCLQKCLSAPVKKIWYKSRYLSLMSGSWTKCGLTLSAVVVCIVVCVIVCVCVVVCVCVGSKERYFVVVFVLGMDKRG